MHWISIVGLFLTVTGEGLASPLTAPPTTSTLQVRVIGEFGQPLDDVTVSFEKEGRQVRLLTDLLGEVELILPNGAYDLTFRRQGFYETVLRKVVIEAPDDPELRSGRSLSLRVLMQRRLIFEKDLEVIGPRSIDPPTLRVDFEPAPSASASRPAKGTALLTNIGEKAIQIALDTRFKWTPETLTMRIVIEIPGTDVHFDEPFLCVPIQGTCRDLAAGESVRIPISLRSRQAYSAGQSQRTIWPGAGEYEGKAGVYFAFPQKPPEETPVYTRLAETVFRITID